MRILVSGSNGLVGSALRDSLSRSDHELIRLVRRPASGTAGEIEWRPPGAPPRPDELEGFDAVVHLAGVNLASGWWTKRRRRAIRESRVDATARLAEALAARRAPPRVLVTASAVGAYGSSPDPVDEDSPFGTGFLADLVRDWEDAAGAARSAGIRVVNARLGIVLSRDGGALPRMLPAFRLGLGARLGDGRQWMSWVSQRDVVSALEFALERDDVSGPVNVVGSTVSNADFTRALGRALRRPAPFVAPAALLRAAAGALAEEMLLASQRVTSRRLPAAGFEFRDRNLGGTLARLVGAPPRRGQRPGG